ncbi:hypothetical protein SAMN04488564_1011003 [Lentzea waywayandensis]|uniref:Uncharacterized protein n=1 Tax=Lentzea waywayandensis TaxID=84724 RepID=A0A1I6D3X8_9PSEU|nr:hypothetical protein [Lentzea waywayandensis]SFR00052.1 hypothetical protein SAMN04488564_1011003 [Lentzea waywayandensis]
MSLAVNEEDGETELTLTVSGVEPSSKCGSHAHAKRCGAKSADAVREHQNEKDPVSPWYANAVNEVLLDFTMDDEGAATSTVTVTWKFREDKANNELHAGFRDGRERVRSDARRRP